MSTRQGYIKDYEDNKIVPMTSSVMVLDVAKNQALSQTLVDTPDKDALGYDAFSTVEEYHVGDVVYYKNKLHKFNQFHSAGEWNENHVDPYSVSDIDEAVSELKERDDMQDTQLTALANTKADKNGNYPQMTVGTAENLLGKGDGVMQEFTYQTTGGTADVADGIAKYQEVHGNSLVWNQLVGVDTTDVETVSGHKYRFLDSMNEIDAIIISTGQILTVEGGIDMVSDLTLMFGAGNEPTTVEYFKSLFPLDYYEYNEGEIINFNGTAIESVGFNQLNIEGRTQYTTSKNPESSPDYIDDGNVIIGYATTGYVRPENIMSFSVSGTDFSVKTVDTLAALSYGIGFPVRVIPSTYYFVNAEMESPQTISITWADAEKRIIGKDNNTTQPVQSPSNAHWAVITFLPNSRTESKTFRNCILNVSWSGIRNGEYEPYKKDTLDLPIARINTDGTITESAEGKTRLFPNGLCSAGSTTVIKDELTANGAICRVGTRAYEEGDEDDATLTTDGTNTNYPLETPIKVTFAEPLNLTQLVSDFGTQQLLPVNDDEPVTTPFLGKVLYGMNAEGMLRNLPKNYISKESMDNFLSALSTTMSGTWTMTWNDTTRKYGFEFTPTLEPEAE